LHNGIKNKHIQGFQASSFLSAVSSRLSFPVFVFSLFRERRQRLGAASFFNKISEMVTLTLEDWKMKKQKKSKWLVKGHFPKNSIGSLIGRDGSLQTDVALDVGFHCATGIPWQGKKVDGGLVFYISGKEINFCKEQEAWEKAHGVKIESSMFIAKQFTPYRLKKAASGVAMVFDPKPQCVFEFIEDTVNAMERHPVLVVLDSLVTDLMGDELGCAQGMELFMSKVKLHLKNNYRCTVLIVDEDSECEEEAQYAN